MPFEAANPPQIPYEGPLDSQPDIGPEIVVDVEARNRALEHIFDADTLPAADVYPLLNGSFGAEELDNKPPRRNAVADI